MKEMYVPTMDELYLMQDMGSNIYRYLVAKAAERLILEGINTPAKGMLKSAYKYLRENYDVASAICSLYPEEMQYSEILKYDPSFCLKLIDEPKPLDTSLDNLSYFNEGTLSNVSVISKTITRLNKVLKNNPKYRFTYKQSKLLDDIFLCRINNLADLKNAFDYDQSNLFNDILSGRFNLSNIKDDDRILLASIEPAYVAKYYEYYSSLFDDKREPDEVLRRGIFDYCNRYNVSDCLGSEYKGKDILTNQPTEVKRLIKCINNK